MNEITICDTLIGIKEYKGQRVVTFKDIDAVHCRTDGTARRNFNINKEHFIEGEDYFKVCADEIRTHKIMDISNKVREDVTLITESGYLMLVKSFTDDLAWTVQRALIKTYFKAQELTVSNTELLREITALKIELEATRKLALYTARSLPQPPDYRIQYNNIAPVLTNLQKLLGKESHKEVLSYIYDTMEQHGGFSRQFAMNRLKSKYPTYYVGDKTPSIINSIIEFPDYYAHFMKVAATIEKNCTAPVISVSSVQTNADKISEAIAPLIAKRNDHSAHGIRTYSIVYGTMGTKASWSQLMRRCGARTKKEVILARPDKYELFCECIEKLMNEI